jgi:hypothetical protein
MAMFTMQGIDVGRTSIQVSLQPALHIFAEFARPTNLSSIEVLRSTGNKCRRPNSAQDPPSPLDRPRGRRKTPHDKGVAVRRGAPKVVQ